MEDIDVYSRIRKGFIAIIASNFHRNEIGSGKGWHIRLEEDAIFNRKVTTTVAELMSSLITSEYEGVNHK